MSSTNTEIHRRIREAHVVRGVVPEDVSVPFRNIHALLQYQVSQRAPEEWLVFYEDEAPVRHSSPLRTSFTYQDFSRLVWQTVQLMVKCGISKGDRIATVASNHADTVVHYFAAWVMGAVVVPVNVGEDDKRIGYILQNSETKLAFVREEYLERLDPIIADIPCMRHVVVVRGRSPGTLRPLQAAAINLIPDFHAAIQALEPAFESGAEVTLEDEALIVYTSGTTGLPKGVVLTQYNLLIDARMISEWHAMTPGQRMMCVLPLHHVNGTIVTIMTPMWYGGSVILNQKFNSGVFFDRIAAEKVQVVSVVPTLLQFLLQYHPAKPGSDLSAFRHIICGAGPLTCELALRFEERFGIPIIHGYGLSETTCYSCFLPIDLSPDEHTRWLKDYGFPSIGVPLPSNEMAIHDEQGNSLEEGMRGEIVIRGLNVMKEYYANPEANDHAFAFGWFRSGDEGFFRSDDPGRKFFFISGRIKELIIRGGTNISPFEIDEVLMNMPGVKAGLAVGFENDWYGEEIGAYVQPAEGQSLTEEGVLTYCRTFFSFQQSPKVVIFGNEIPVTSTGKYQRNKLKHLFEPWKTVQFTERSGSPKK